MAADTDGQFLFMLGFLTVAGIIFLSVFIGSGIREEHPVEDNVARRMHQEHYITLLYRRNPIRELRPAGAAGGTAGAAGAAPAARKLASRRKRRNNQHGI